MTRPIETWPWEDLDEETLLSCCALWILIWPKDDQDAAMRAAHLHDEVRRRSPQMRAHQLHLVREDDGRVIAAARSFQRTIACRGSAGDPHAVEHRQVLALASVCCDPALRGAGRATRLVRAAFGRLNADCPVSLFQTSVPDFYRRLGASTIDCRIVNSHDDGPAFWDPHAMIHPGDSPWRYHEVDLLGPGW